MSSTSSMRRAAREAREREAKEVHSPSRRFVAGGVGGHPALSNTFKTSAADAGISVVGNEETRHIDDTMAARLLGSRDRAVVEALRQRADEREKELQIRTEENERLAGVVSRLASELEAAHRREEVSASYKEANTDTRLTESLRGAEQLRQRNSQLEAQVRQHKAEVNRLQELVEASALHTSSGLGVKDSHVTVVTTPSGANVLRVVLPAGLPLNDAQLAWNTIVSQQKLLNDALEATRAASDAEAEVTECAAALRRLQESPGTSAGAGGDGSVSGELWEAQSRSAAAAAKCLRLETESERAVSLLLNPRPAQSSRAPHAVLMAVNSAFDATLNHREGNNVADEIGTSESASGRDTTSQHLASLRSSLDALQQSLPLTKDVAQSHVTNAIAQPLERAAESLRKAWRSHSAVVQAERGTKSQKGSASIDDMHARAMYWEAVSWSLQAELDTLEQLLTEGVGGAGANAPPSNAIHDGYASTVVLQRSFTSAMDDAVHAHTANDNDVELTEALKRSFGSDAQSLSDRPACTVKGCDHSGHDHVHSSLLELDALRAQRSRLAMSDVKQVENASAVSSSRMTIETPRKADAALNTDLAQARAELSVLRKEIERLRTKLADAQGAATMSLKMVKKREAEVEARLSSRAELASALSIAESQVASQREELKRQAEALRSSQKAAKEAVEAANVAAGRANDAQGKVTEVEQAYASRIDRKTKDVEKSRRELSLATAARDRATSLVQKEQKRAEEAEDKVATLERDVSKANRKLRGVEAEVARLRSRADEAEALRARADAAEKAVGTERKARHRAEAQLVAFSGERSASEESQRAVHTAEVAKAEAEAKAEQAQASLEAANKRATHALEEKERLNKMVETLRTAIAESAEMSLQSERKLVEIEAEARSSRSEGARYEGEIETLRNLLRTAEQHAAQEVSDLSRRVDSAEGALYASEAKCANIEREFLRVRTAANEAEHSATSAARESLIAMGRAEDRCRRLATMAEDQIATLEGKRKKLEDKVGRYKSTLEARDVECEGLRRAIDAANDKVSRAEQMRLVAESEVDDVRRRLVQAQDDSAAARREVAVAEAAAARIPEMDAAVSSLREANATLQRALALEREAGAVRRSPVPDAEDLPALKARCDVAEEDSGRLRRQIADAREEAALHRQRALISEASLNEALTAASAHREEEEVMIRRLREAQRELSVAKDVEMEATESRDASQRELAAVQSRIKSIAEALGLPSTSGYTAIPVNADSDPLLDAAAAAAVALRRSKDGTPEEAQRSMSEQLSQARQLLFDTAAALECHEVENLPEVATAKVASLRTQEQMAVSSDAARAAEAAASVEAHRWLERVAGALDARDVVESLDRLAALQARAAQLERDASEQSATNKAMSAELSQLRRAQNDWEVGRLNKIDGLVREVTGWQEALRASKQQLAETQAELAVYKEKEDPGTNKGKSKGKSKRAPATAAVDTTVNQTPTTRAPLSPYSPPKPDGSIDVVLSSELSRLRAQVTALTADVADSLAREREAKSAAESLRVQLEAAEGRLRTDRTRQHAADASEAERSALVAELNQLRLVTPSKSALEKPVDGDISFGIASGGRCVELGQSSTLPATPPLANHVMTSPDAQSIATSADPNDSILSLSHLSNGPSTDHIAVPSSIVRGITEALGLGAECDMSKLPWVIQRKNVAMARVESHLADTLQDLRDLSDLVTKLRTAKLLVDASVLAGPTLTPQGTPQKVSETPGSASRGTVDNTSMAALAGWTAEVGAVYQQWAALTATLQQENAALQGTVAGLQIETNDALSVAARSQEEASELLSQWNDTRVMAEDAERARADAVAQCEAALATQRLLTERQTLLASEIERREEVGASPDRKALRRLVKILEKTPLPTQEAQAAVQVARAEAASAQEAMQAARGRTAELMQEVQMCRERVAEAERESSVLRGEAAASRVASEATMRALREVNDALQFIRSATPQIAAAEATDANTSTQSQSPFSRSSTAVVLETEMVSQMRVASQRIESLLAEDDAQYHRQVGALAVEGRDALRLAKQQLSELASVQSRLRVAEEEIERLQHEAKAKLEEREELQNQLNKARDDRVTATAASNARLKQALEDMLASQEAERGKLTSMSDEVQQELDEARAIIESQSQETATAEARATQAESELVAARREAAMARSDAADAHELLRRRAAGQATADHTAEELWDDVEDTERHLVRAADAMSALLVELEEREVELTTTRSQLAELARESLAFIGSTTANQSPTQAEVAAAGADMTTVSARLESLAEAQLARRATLSSNIETTAPRLFKALSEPLANAPAAATASPMVDLANVKSLTTTAAATPPTHATLSSLQRDAQTIAPSSPTHSMASSPTAASIAVLEAALSASDERVRALITESEASDRTIDDLNAQLANVRAELAAQQTEDETRVGALEFELSDCKSEIAMLRAALDTARQRADDDNSNVEALTAVLQQQVSALRSDLAASNARADAAVADLDASRSEADVGGNLASEVESLRASVQAREVALIELGESLAAAEEEIGVQVMQTQNLREQLNACNAECARLEVIVAKCVCQFTKVEPSPALAPVQEPVRDIPEEPTRIPTSPTTPSSPVRRMVRKKSVQLTAKQSFEVGSTLSRVCMGLGWNLVPGATVDLDASVALFGHNGVHLEDVYFCRQTGHGGHVVHSGDNLTGEGDGDDEIVSVDLHKLDAKVKVLLFTVCVYTDGVSFDSVAGASCRLLQLATDASTPTPSAQDVSSNTELCRFDIDPTVMPQAKDCSSIVMSAVRRRPVVVPGEQAWEVVALGRPVNGRNVRELRPTLIEIAKQTEQEIIS